MHTLLLQKEQVITFFLIHDIYYTWSLFVALICKLLGIQIQTRYQIIGNSLLHIYVLYSIMQISSLAYT